jgi:NADH-quinone oxidoreductase subunit G
MAEMVTLTIDDTQVEVPKGTLLIRAAEAAGIAIPRFCDHPLLDPAAACRECMVEITDAGNGRGFPKPQPSCATTVAAGMQVKTQQTSAAAAEAQADILELLLINHPLDCPICDKAGECPLQNQAMADGRTQTRYDGVKRTFPTPIALSDQILLDRERCVLCTRCTRFAEQIAGDPFISLVERGAKQQIGIYPEQPFDSYFSGNVTQICPVGALTSADYRFTARPFDLTSTPSTCDNCAAGCAIRIDARHNSVRRRLAGDDPQVNDEWSCDRGRFGFRSGHGTDRVTRPMVRRDGALVAVSWPEALTVAAEGLALAGESSAVLTSGRLTEETAYAYAKFARLALKTNAIDCRVRQISDEETAFLASVLAPADPDKAVSYADLDQASQVFLVDFEPEEESPIVFLRLRKAHRASGLKIVSVAPFLSRGATKLDAQLIATRPGEQPAAIAQLPADGDSLILVGERAAATPGVLTAVLALVEKTGSRLAWIPRRAGEIGAIRAGLFPGLLPAGRPINDPDAQIEMAAAWKTPVPLGEAVSPLNALAAGDQSTTQAFVIAGGELADLPDPGKAAAALKQAFVVCLESRLSDVTAQADVVLPVSLPEEVTGSLIGWDLTRRPVNAPVSNQRSPMTEIRVLAALTETLGLDLGFRTAAAAAAELAGLAPWSGPISRKPEASAVPVDSSSVVLASWRQLLDDSRCLDGAEQLLAGARPAVAVISPQTQRTQGMATSRYVRLTGPAGSITLPLVVDPTMIDQAIWVPSRNLDQSLASLGLAVGDAVTLASAPEPGKDGVA